jgi:hypothetical protein
MKILILLCAIIFLNSCAGSSEEENKLAAKVDSLQNEIRQLEQANDTLSDYLMKKSYLTREFPEYFDTISEPEKFILEKLQGNKKLISKEAVLGGTMRFTKVSFVNEELVVAEYEDGHVMGRGIYSYKMNKEGNLSFKLVGTIR